MPHFTATFVLCDGPHSVCGVCFSLYLTKSTSYLSLCLSLNSFCDETSRTWASLGPETRYCGFWLGSSPSHVVSSPKQGFDWVWVPAMWVRVPLCGKWFQNYWRFNLSISSSNEYSGLISFRTDWFDSLKSKGLSRVFYNTTAQKHQFFRVQISLWSNAHIHTWPLDKSQFWLYRPLSTKYVSAF